MRLISGVEILKFGGGGAGSSAVEINILKINKTTVPLTPLIQISKVVLSFIDFESQKCICIIILYPDDDDGVAMTPYLTPHFS